ncbi:unnamed protein product [Camellia sinensis]
MCSCIERPRLCPCLTINCYFLKVLDNMLGFTRTCHISKNMRPVMVAMEVMATSDDRDAGDDSTRGYVRMAERLGKGGG